MYFYCCLAFYYPCLFFDSPFMHPTFVLPSSISASRSVCRCFASWCLFDGEKSKSERSKARQMFAQFEPELRERKQGLEEMPLKVAIKKWHSVCVWQWATREEDCAICHQPFERTCPSCAQPGDECPPVWGACDHHFHLHCVLHGCDSRARSANARSAGETFASRPARARQTTARNNRDTTTRMTTRSAGDTKTEIFKFNLVHKHTCETNNSRATNTKQTNESLTN